MDVDNFIVLVFNCVGIPNIIRFQAALGEGGASVDLERRPDNCGAHQVSGYGNIPVMRVDDLALDECDLLMLDVEGYEMKALLGARRTIAHHRPVIVIEDKGLSERYGVKLGEAPDWLVTAYGYRIVAKPHRDVVLVPCERR